MEINEKDSVYFESKIQKLEERISFLEELTKEMAFEKRICERWKGGLAELEKYSESKTKGESGKPGQVLVHGEDNKPTWVDDKISIW
jgi:hypothetical protein